MSRGPTDRRAATRLGAYEIVRPIATGGMAEIFLARSSGPQGFEKLVVLKKILPHFASAPRYVQLFLDEAKLAACLAHPNIAQIHDIGMVEGNYCITMEYIHGRDLRTVTRACADAGKSFPIEHAVRIGIEIASALHHAHERRGPDGVPLQIVHRDVSPSNIQISFDGDIKLLDFGVAKARISSIRTATGSRKGKPGYLSPEQARTAPVDRRSDVFAVGIVLWEMLTGRRLYDAPGELKACEQILTKVPSPPSLLRASCPPELDAIILRALAHDTADRYQTAQELQVELEELARELKLKQSPIALRELMHELFEAEVNASDVGEPTQSTVTDMIAASAEGTPPEDEAEDAPAPRSREESTTAVLPVRPKQSFHDEPTRSLSKDELSRLVSQAGVARGLSAVSVLPAAPVAPAPVRETPTPPARLEDSVQALVDALPKPSLDDEPTREGRVPSSEKTTKGPGVIAARHASPVFDLPKVEAPLFRTAQLRATPVPGHRWLLLIALGLLAVIVVVAIALQRSTHPGSEPPPAASAKPDPAPPAEAAPVEAPAPTPAPAKSPDHTTRPTSRKNHR